MIFLLLSLRGVVCLYGAHVFAFLQALSHVLVNITIHNGKRHDSRGRSCCP